MSRFSQLVSGVAQAQDMFVSRQQATFEEKIVSTTLRKFGLWQNIDQMLLECQKISGSRHLNFEWFCSKYHSFPIYIGTRKIPNPHTITVADFKNRLTNTKLFENYQDIVDQLDDNQQTRSVGLVFDWPAFHTATIFHNMSVDLTKPGTRIVKVFEKLGCYTAEPFDDFLNNLVWDAT